ncbi:hypothetical protein FJZ26_05500 [Candidatus Parvarchaeota archaeon]|nr:hypothetical protein [Candidatus Parvarchaeota archaeon]
MPNIRRKFAGVVNKACQNIENQFTLYRYKGGAYESRCAWVLKAGVKVIKSRHNGLRNLIFLDLKAGIEAGVVVLRYGFGRLGRAVQVCSAISSL